MKTSSRQARAEALWGWLFLLPTLCGLMILNIIPIFQTILQSFFKTGVFGKGNVFVGFANYIKMWEDPAVGQALARLEFKGKNIAFALLFPGLVTAFGTFLLRQAFMTLPKDLEQAARLDGCNIGQTFLLIMLPLVKSGMVALSIFTVLFAFKELMWPLVVNTDQTTIPLSAALAKLQGQFAANYPELMAASFLACLPMIVLYIIFQKQFVAGIATSGSKL